MTMKTVTQVVDTPREWDGQYGHNYTFGVTFADGEQGEVTTNKAERVTELRDSLKALVGKPTEFELQDGGKWPSGDTRPWRIKSYPGKPGSQDGQRSGGSGGRPRHDPETNASIEAQVAAKIAGELAVAYIGAPSGVPGGDAVRYVQFAVSEITWAIRQAARGKESESDRSPSGESLPPPDSDAAEGEAPGASPKADLGWGTGPMTAKQKAKLNMLYGSAGAVTKAARTMFPEVAKVGDITETIAAALIEDKEQG